MKISSAKFLKYLLQFCLFLLIIITVIILFYNVYNLNKFSKIADKHCKNYDLDKSLVLAIIKVESNFNKDAISSKGACGLMQLKPSTFDYVKNLQKYNFSLNIFNESDNILIGCAYFRYLLDKFGNVDLALCAFNAGEGNVSNWLKNEQYTKDGITLNYIPFPETKKYVKKIKFYYSLYSKVI